jgi:dUTPase
MKTLKVQIKRLPAQKISPAPYNDESGGGNGPLAAVTGEETIPPGGRKKIPTGIAVALRKAMRRRFARAAAWRCIRA